MKLSYKHLFRHTPTLNNTVWMLGCSFIWGTAIPDDQTVPVLLEKEIKHPVDNLGIGAASPKLVHYVLNDLLQEYTPHAIIVSWPFYNRTYYTDNDNNIVNLGPWVFESYKTEKQYDRQIIEKFKDDTISGALREENIKLVKSVKNTIRYPYLSFRYAAMPEIVNNKNKFLDYASDGRHPGPITNSLVIKYMSSWYNNFNNL